MSGQAGFHPHVTTLGAGPHRILALHCTMAFGGAWGGIAKVLGPQAQLICPDMPSHGRSPDWDEKSDFGDTVFASAVDTLGQGPMDVVGHSFGAAIALRLALAHPDRVSRLVLFEPVLFAVALADDPDSMGDHDSRASPFMQALARGERQEGARAFNRMWSGAGQWGRLPQSTKDAMARAVHVVPGTTPFLYDDAKGILKPGVLGGLNMPVLLMSGADTLDAVKATNAGLARRIGANAQQVVIAKAGHMAPITHPVELGTAIAAHFDIASP